MRTLLFLTAILYAIGFIGCGGSKVGWIDKTPYYDDAIADAATWAVLVGIDDYQDPRIGDLNYTVNDVTQVYEALIDPQVGAVPKSNVYLMTNRSTGENLPTHTNVLLRLENLTSHISLGDTFIFYFSGHGVVREKEQYLLSINADFRSLITLESTAIPLKRLQRLLEVIRAHQMLIILDACRNDPEASKGDGENLLTDALAKAVRVRPRASANPSPNFTATFYACSLNQRAYEWHERNHSVFSYYLVEGLRGKAADRQGRVTLRGLADYVTMQVSDWSRQHLSGKRQTPWLRSEGATDMVLATLPPPPVETLPSLATLKVSSEPSGAVVYVDGERRGTTPVEIKVDTGVADEVTVRVALQLDGYVTQKGRVTLRAGQITPWNVTLERLSAPVLDWDLQEYSSWLGDLEDRLRAGIRRGDQNYRELLAEIKALRKKLGDNPFGRGDSINQLKVRLGQIDLLVANVENLQRAVSQIPNEDLTGTLTELPHVLAGLHTLLSSYRSDLRKVGEVLEILGSNPTPLEMVQIPAGEFHMGSTDGGDDEMPVHTVYIDAFYMDKHEVTNAQYKKFVDATGHPAPHFWDVPRYNAPDHPVVAVSWEEAVAYCEWAGKRLPTEAEWEKAARGRLVGKQYPWGDEVPDGTQCNFADRNVPFDVFGKNMNADDGYPYTSPVGSFPPNGYGLYDMAGNVHEWCADWYSKDYYAKSPKRNPSGPSWGKDRVFRDGDWAVIADELRVAKRGHSSPTPGGESARSGFRCVMSSQEYQKRFREAAKAALEALP